MGRYTAIRIDQRNRLRPCGFSPRSRYSGSSRLMLLPGKPYDRGRRPVRVCLILREPSFFDIKNGPPRGLHRLLVSEPQPLDEYELERVSPAADSYRSLHGVRHGTHEGLQIRGIVHSGSRWVQNIYGGRVIAPPLPPRWLFT